MNVSDAFHRYAEKVCEQIRWKKAHPAVAQEIEDHLTDQKNAYLAAGDSESIAEEKALLQMGDPVSVGAALDQTHKPAPQWGMIGLVLLLFVLGGIIQVLLLKTIPVGNDALATRSAQVLFVFLPLILATFVGMYFLDFSFFGKHPYVLPLGLLMVDLAAQLFGVSYCGKRWFTLGSFALSPLALSLLFPLAFCGLFYRLRKQGRKGYLLSGLLAAVFCLFLAFCHYRRRYSDICVLRGNSHAHCRKKGMVRQEKSDNSAVAFSVSGGLPDCPADVLCTVSVSVWLGTPVYDFRPFR